MTDRTTINVSKEARDVAREAKRDGETWGDYLRRCADVDTASTDAPEVVEASVDTDEIATKVVDDLTATLPMKIAEEMQR